MATTKFPELEQLGRIIDCLGDRAQVQVLTTVSYKDMQFPIHCITLGSKQADAPVLAFIGGVHGLEKIGSEVILSYLETLSQLLDWDDEFLARLEKSRLVFIPLVNPVGVYLGTRSNGNCVDLMRNAPIEGEGLTKLYSGHRISPVLPWYRGLEGTMELEAQTLCDAVKQQLFKAPVSIALDLHSGFGIKDRLWFPYASRMTPFANLPEVFALKTLLDRCYKHHIYKVEPVSNEYVINGDLWDYLYDEYLAQKSPEQVFLPLTLEMGSWLWLRKNPTHLFSRHGLFHPLLPHRQQRIYRRHFMLFDFLHRSLLNPQPWTGLTEQQRISNFNSAKAIWYD